MNNFMRTVNSIKGITLIALAITIIILLILAGITISTLTGNNGLIGKAGKAKEETEISSEKEIVEISTVQALGANKEGNIEKEKLEKYLDSNAGNGKTEVIDEENILIVKFVSSNRYYKIDEDGTVNKYVVTDRKGINVGDYINYEPAKNEDGTAKTYSKDNLVENITGSTDNTVDIIQDGLQWQVLRIYKDGSMDLIGSPTSQGIHLKGAEGYNNGVNVIHDICEKIYSREGIIARSVTLEDMERWLTEAGKNAKSTYITNQISGLSANNVIEKVNKDNNTVTYKKIRAYYPNLYSNEIGAGIDTTEVRTAGMKDIDKVTDLDNSISPNSYKQAENLTTKQTDYTISINSTNYGDGSKALRNDYGCWVASRYVSCNSNCADFGLRVALGNLTGLYLFTSSNQIVAKRASFLRPVVSLGSEVQITASSTASTSTGTPHIITEY